MDVALEHVGTETYLWSAVDHLGLVRFKVTVVNAWSHTMPIDHQEGELLTNGDAEEQVRLVRAGTGPNDEPSGVRVRTYAHRLSILERDEDSDGVKEKRVLAAAVLNQPYFQSDGLLDEGRTLDYLTGSSQGVHVPYPLPGPDTGGEKPYTMLYDLRDLGRNPPATAPPLLGAKKYNYAVLMKDFGGLRVRLAPEPAALQVLLLGTKKVPLPSPSSQTNFLATYPWPLPTQTPTPTTLYERRTEHRPGRHGSDIGHSLANPDVLFTGSNDAGLPPDGILTTCSDGIRRDFYQPDPTDGGDTRATFGVVFDPFAVWLAPAAGRDYAAGAGREFVPPLPPNPQRKRWMMVQFKGGSNLCPGMPTDPPNREKRMYIESNPDRFLEHGRGNYIAATVDLEYDAHLLATPSITKQILIGTRDRSPDGLVVLDRGKLEFTFTTIGDGAWIDPTLPAFDDFLDDLDTHPEYFNVDETDSSTTGFMNDHDLSEVVTHFPVFLQVPSHDEEGPPEHWIMAAGAGTIFFPEGLRQQLDPNWSPDLVYQTNEEHSMLRIFDVENPALMFDQDRTTSPPVYTLIGPDQGSHAYRVHTFELTERDYLAVADLGGAVQIWDLTDLLDPITPSIIEPNLPTYGNFFLEEWQTPESVSDDLPNGVWSIDAELAHLSGPDRDIERIYAMVARVGIEVLEFDATSAPGSRLTQVAHIETPSGSGGIHIRDNPFTDVTDLLVIERDSGLRIFER